MFSFLFCLLWNNLKDFIPTFLKRQQTVLVINCYPFLSPRSFVLIQCLNSYLHLVTALVSKMILPSVQMLFSSDDIKKWGAASVLSKCSYMCKPYPSIVLV